MVVAMSGGVDSSVAAALLLKQGYEVVGCFMRLGSDDEAEAADGYDNIRDESCDLNQAQKAKHAAPKAHKQGCCSVNDAGDARLVAAMLGVPFYVLNFKKDFGRIINYFVDEYNAGRTPNPCVRCNDWLKFGKLHDYARSIDADYIASGHYARIERADGNGRKSGGGGARLMRGLDEGKDQSYVLFGSPRQRLDEMLLPIGDMHKSDVRQLARDLKLPVGDKPDSQEICFVPDNDYARLVERRSPEAVRPGDILDAEGNVVGEHPGHQHFTIGQRRGVGVALGYPIYVTHLDPAGNTVTVGGKDDLLATGLTAGQTNWLTDDVPTDGWLACGVMVRYNSRPTPGKVRVTSPGTLEVRFDQPVSAVTPGQAVVCYDGERVLGGGWIDRAH
ncbi:MAG: tRNA 2-thiouridine(34) synthase MnmA [Phycisphaerales bacterium]